MRSNKTIQFAALACLALAFYWTHSALAAEHANLLQADVECVADLSPDATGPMKRQIELLGLTYETSDQAGKCEAVLINAALYKPESLLKARKSLRSGKVVIVDFQSVTKRHEEFYGLLGLLANPKRNSPLIINAEGAVVRWLGADNYQVTPIELFSGRRQPNLGDNSLANVLTLRR